MHTYRRTMKNITIISLITLALVSCSQDENRSASTLPGGDSIKLIAVDNVRTQDELDIFLKQKYGDIQSLPSIWQGSRDSSFGDFRYRLSDGKEISIPGIYTSSTGNIVDPEFDLRTLPD